MIARDEVYKSERLLYKAHHKGGRTPKKSNHKHYYVPCVFHILDGKTMYSQSHGLIKSDETTIGKYCPECGKIGSIHNRDPEWAYMGYSDRYKFRVRQWIWTEAAEKEFNPETRTLPFFEIKELWKKKYVEVKND